MRSKMFVNIQSKLTGNKLFLKFFPKKSQRMDIFFMHIKTQWKLNDCKKLYFLQQFSAASQIQKLLNLQNKLFRQHLDRQNATLYT